MAANGRGNMRPAGRSPPFLAIGLFVALLILGFNYWSLSSRNGEQANEISLMESELRLVNAKKTSAEKRSEAISDKVTELEKQLNEQKEVIASNRAELANVEKEKQTFIERTNDLENEVKNIRDQQLPSCETDRTNLQQEVEQLRADVEVHKNKQCDRSACETVVLKERDATIEDVYRVVGAIPLISMYKSNVNLGSYKDQISSLAAKMDKESLEKQQKENILQQQQQPKLEQPTYNQEQQQPADSLQQQQQPADTLQQQQQQPADSQQQQQQPADYQQQQQQADSLPQIQPADSQLQQQLDDQQQQQPAGQNDETVQEGTVQPAGQDSNLGAGEAGMDKSNLDVEDRDTLKAANADLLDGRENKANLTKTNDSDPEQKSETNTTTKRTTTATSMKPGSMTDIPLKAPNVTVTGNITTANKKSTVQNVVDVGADAVNADHYEDDDDLDKDEVGVIQDDTLRVHDNEDDDYDYDDDKDDDGDDYNYDEKTNGDLTKDENAIDEMFRRDKAVVDTPLQ